MERELIAIREYCIYYNADERFIEDLAESGLVELVREEDGPYVRFDQLKDLERFVHWRYELEMNLEGIEVAQHLLNKMKGLQQRLRELEARLLSVEH